jgi:hypothetical protein
MIYVIGLVVFVVLVVAIAQAASGDRYANMSEEEYEAEVKRGSLMGAAVAGLQKVIDPDHHVQHIEEQAQRLEADSADLGDRHVPGQGKRD